MSLREAVGQSLGLLGQRDKRRLLLATCIQVSTSFLDLIGVLLLGLVGVLAATTVQSQPPPEIVTRVEDQLGLEGLTNVQLLVILSCLAAFVLLLKSLMSALLLRRVFIFLASRQAVVSARLARALFSRPLTFVQTRSSQEISYALIQGASAATLGVLGQAVVFVSESALLVILALLLLVVSPVIALSSIVFFALVALVLQYSLGNWASASGRRISEADMASLDAIQEVVSAYREVTIANRRSAYVHRIEDLRWRSARGASDYQFIAAFPKYVFEVALVVGGFALAGVLFATRDVSAAVGTLTLFLAAASRIMPSILRLQGSAVSIRNASGTATSTIDLAAAVGDLDEFAPIRRTESTAGAEHAVHDLEPHVILEDVTFTYPGSTVPAVREVNLGIPAGHSVALVGSSGAGKSTLADLMLGVLEPDVGTASIGGLSPAEAISAWVGSIGYVPQDVVLANATIRSNVALGLPRELIDDDLVWEALERAHIADLLVRERESLDTLVGERGVRLSGGQRQRLGIARALYSKPRLLVLDEATSALDAETEAAISQTFRELEGAVTTIIIAHRLSTVRHVDEVVYLEKGSVLATGSFDVVRREVPAFDRQALAMGLR